MKKRHFAALLLSLGIASYANAEHYELLNVSYDATRELFHDINLAFSRHYARKHNGDTVSVAQSHSGSVIQARNVVDGLPADVVSLAQDQDIEYIAEKTGKIDPEWSSRLPNNASPYTSAIVFLVRKGNPKNIQDWYDLIATRDVQIITPNPKTSAAARYNYIAAYAYADIMFEGDEAKIKNFMTNFYSKVPVMNTGIRGAAITFIQKQVGDVLLTWENEANLSLDKNGWENYEIITPSVSVMAKPQIAVVTKNAEKHGNLEVAKEYAEYMFSDDAQEILAKHHYRPYNEFILKRYEKKFARLKLVEVNDYGGLKEFSDKHFAEGGWFDQIQKEIYEE